MSIAAETAGETAVTRRKARKEGQLMREYSSLLQSICRETTGAGCIEYAVHRIVADEPSVRLRPMAGIVILIALELLMLMLGNSYRH